MSLYLYLARNTCVHRLDPRAKFVGIVAFFGAALSFDHPLPQAVLVAVLAALITAARAWPTVGRLRGVLIVLAVTALVIWSLLGRGETPLFWRFTVEGVLFGLGTSLKLVNMILTGALLLSTTRNEEFLGGMLKLGLPFPVGFAFSTALRLVPTFVGSGLTIIEAQRSRGLDLSQGSWLQRIRKQIPMLIPVIASAIRSTNQLAMAVEAKAFGYSKRRTQYLELRFTLADWIATALLLALFGGALWLRFGLGFGTL